MDTQKSKSTIRLFSFFLTVLLLVSGILPYAPIKQAHASSGVGTGNSGTLTANGSLRGVGGGIDYVGDATFRVGVSSKPKLKNEGGNAKSQGDMFDVAKNYIPGNFEGLYFVPNDKWRSDFTVGEYYPSMRQLGKMDKATAGKIVKRLQSPIHSNPGNPGKTVIKNAVSDKDYSKLKNNGWKKHLGSINNSAVMSMWTFILSPPSGVEDGLMGESSYAIVPRMNQVISPSAKDWGVAKLTDAQNRDIYEGYLGLLIGTYKLLPEGDTKGLQLMRQRWEKMINDFLVHSKSSDAVAPSTLIIDPVMTIKWTGKEERLYLSAMDYQYFHHASQQGFTLDGEIELGSSAGNYYDMIKKAVSMDVAANKSVFRTSANYDASNAFSWGASAIDYPGKVLHTSRGNVRWVTSNSRTAFIDTLTYLKKDSSHILRGFITAGFHGLQDDIDFEDPSTSTVDIKLTATPKNFLIPSGTEVIGQRNNLSIKAGNNSETVIGQWDKILYDLKDVNNDVLTLKITFQRTASPSASNPPTYASPLGQINNIKMSKTQFTKFIRGESEILVTDESVRNEPMAKGTTKKFDYTAVLEVVYNNEEGQKTAKSKEAKDYASYIRPNDPPKYMGHTSTHAEFSEIKHERPHSEHYNAMSGVPSNKRLYYAVGGSEFIVDTELEYIENEDSVWRTYRSHFTGVPSEYKSGDNAGTGSIGGFSVDLHNGGSYTKTWSGSIPNKGVASTVSGSGDVTAVAVAIPDMTAFNADLKLAEAYAKEVNATVQTHTAASDRITRSHKGWNATVSPGPNPPQDVVDTKSCWKEGTRGTPPEPYRDPCAATASASPAPAGNYVITVTFTVPAHIIDGPECTYDLPDVNDTWKQRINYDYIKIIRAEVYKLEEGRLEKTGVVLGEGSDEMRAKVTQGNQTLWFNIAQRNANGNDTEAQSSKHGRLRYTLEEAQHDTVYWNEGARINKSAGMGRNGVSVAPDVAGTKAVQGGGHTNSWATQGILYNRMDYSAELNAHRKSVGTKSNISTDVDSYDMATPEWRKFNERRNLPVTATVVSDYIILQTSSGDQSVMYFQKDSQTVKAQEQFPDVNATREQMWENNPLSAAKWADNKIYLGSYNGQYEKIGTGCGANQKYHGYDRSTLTFKNNCSAGTPHVATRLDTLGAGPNATWKRPARPTSQLLMYETKDIVPTTPNDDYRFGDSKVFYERLLTYKSSNPYKNFPGIALRENLYTASAQKDFDNRTGMAVKAPYSPNHDRINDVVIHTPNSSQDAMIIANPQWLDQRTHYPDGGAASLIDKENAERVAFENSQATPNIFDDAIKMWTTTKSTTTPVTTKKYDISKMDSSNKVTRDFTYTEAPQTFTAPVTGTYNLEVWGAQGGGDAYRATSVPGKGGYSSGKVRLNKGEKLEVYVGGQGTIATGYFNGGGWNGGGAGGTSGSGGGGATDIRRPMGTYTLASEKMYLRAGTENVNGVAVMNSPEEGVYGPYIPVTPGRYQVDVYGTGLNNGRAVVYTDTGNTDWTNRVSYVYRSDTHVTYYVDVPVATSIIEFCWHASNSNHQTFIRETVTALSDRLIVAGGGGGTDDQLPSEAFNANNGTGGHGGGLTGGNALIDGVAQASTGGTQTSGYALGQGEAATTVTDTGGGGGGYYGGRVTNHYSGGAGGGSGYIGGVTGGTTLAGQNYGNGKARISWSSQTASSSYDEVSETGMSKNATTQDYYEYGDPNSFKGYTWENLFGPNWRNYVTTTTSTETITQTDAFSTVIKSEETELSERVRWDFNNSLEGFSSGSTAISTTANALKGTINQVDGYFFSPPNLAITNLDNTKDFVEIRLKNNSAGTLAQMYYESTARPSFTEESVIHFTMTPWDNDYKTYRIRMDETSNWKGTLNRLRFDLANGVTSGEVLVDYIAVYTTSGLGIEGIETKTFGGSKWARVFYQDISNNTNYFTADTMLNVNRPGMFSALGKLNELKSGSKFEFMLNYPDATGEFAGAYNRWKQTNNPLDQRTNAGEGTANAVGFEPIHMGMTGYGGKGLEYNGIGSVLDGTVNHNNWWLAVGIMNHRYEDTTTPQKPYTMPGPHNGVTGQGVSKVELWLNVDGLATGGGSSNAPTTPTNYGYSGSIKTFTAPATGQYQLETWGAQGGSNNTLGGKGAYAKSIVTLNAGETVKILVGQLAGYGISAGGGGGGTFITSNSNIPLAVAGGGGGLEYGRAPGNWSHGQATQQGGVAPGASVVSVGYGGSNNPNNSGSSGGGGFYGNGMTSNHNYGNGGISFLNGGARQNGGIYSGTPYGGFGGGASTHGNSGGGGGGGGFTGGSGGNHDSPGSGGGGGSYYTGTGGQAIAGYQTMPRPDGGTQIGHPGDGYARITPLEREEENKALVKFTETVTNNIKSDITKLIERTTVAEHLVKRDLALFPDYMPDGTYNPIKAGYGNGETPTSPLDKPVETSAGGLLHMASFLTLDREFKIYYPNRGDFAQQPTLKASPYITTTRGAGYVNGMDTTEWTDSKYVRFAYAVIYNGVLYPSNTWINLPLEQEYFDFYNVLANDEALAAKVEFHTVAINAPSLANDNWEDLTNKTRYENFTAKHGSYKRVYIDIIGRIGNLSVVDTDDFRFSNLFKQEVAGNEWIVEGVLKKVNPNKQNKYYGDAIDIRGEDRNSTLGLNTYGTQKWLEKSRLSLPINPKDNVRQSLYGEYLKPGYDIYGNIQTTGNYANGAIRILPYYYKVEFKNGGSDIELIPLDVYQQVESDYKPVNRYGAADNGYVPSDIHTYPMIVDWENEAGRFNYTVEESTVTALASEYYGYPVFGLTPNEDGVLIDGVQEVLPLNTPSGNYVSLGNSQRLVVDPTLRTFVGNYETYGEDKNPGKVLSDSEYHFKGQKWYYKVGLPANSVFVKSGADMSAGNARKSIEEIQEGDGVVLMTADIVAVGNVYSLRYNQYGNPQFTVEKDGRNIPIDLTQAIRQGLQPYLALYDLETTAIIDVETQGSH